MFPVQKGSELRSETRISNCVGLKKTAFEITAYQESHEIYQFENNEQGLCWEIGCGTSR